MLSTSAPYRILVASLVLFAAGCGGETPPEETVTETTATPAAADEAAAPGLPLPGRGDAFHLIANSKEFADFQSTRSRLTLPVKLSGTSPTERGTAGALEAAGWLRIENDGRIVPTRGQYDYRFSTSGDQIEIGPIARKHVKSVEAVHEHRNEQALVEFTWEWMPDDIGELFAFTYRKDQRALATLEREGSEWRVARIDAWRGWRTTGTTR